MLVLYLVLQVVSNPNGVRLASNDGEIRDSRGLARALSGDIPGAIADFQFYVDWMKARGGSGGRITTRAAWIAALQAVADPAEVFDEETLKELRGR